MDITVVVSNFNYGRFLGRCIRSILAQSIEKSAYEIIVVDDCSTDDSIAVLNSFGTSISYFQNETNMGLAFTVNSGISKAKSRYVVRVDADDYIHADFLKMLLLGFEFFGKEVQAISVDYWKVSPNGDIESYGSADTDPIACGIAFKMDALEFLGFYNGDLRIDEEIDLKHRFDSANFKIRNINLPLYRYVQHSDSLSKSVLN